MKNLNTFSQKLTTKLAGLAAILCFVLFTLPTIAQNVGIGATVPVAELHIQKTAAGRVGAVIENPGTGDPVIRLENGGGGQIFTIGLDNSTANDNFVISDNTDLGTNDRLVIDGSSGKVGIGTSSPTSNLEVNGAIAMPYQKLTNAGVTLDENDYWVSIACGSSDRTVALPAGAGCVGRIYIIQKLTGTGDVIIDPAGAEKIGPSTTKTLSVNGSWAMIVSTGNAGAEWESLVQ